MCNGPFAPTSRQTTVWLGSLAQPIKKRRTRTREKPDEATPALISYHGAPGVPRMAFLGAGLPHLETHPTVQRADAARRGEAGGVGGSADPPDRTGDDQRSARQKRPGDAHRPPADRGNPPAVWR